MYSYQELKSQLNNISEFNFIFTNPMFIKENDNKYITNKSGERIYFYQIKEQINEYEKIQDQYGFIKEKDKEAIDIICKKLLNEYLDIEYEWNEESNSQYEIHIQTEMTKNDYIIICGDFGGVWTFEEESSRETDILTDYLQEISEKCEFKKWYFGHYHDYKQINSQFILLYEDIVPLEFESVFE